MQRIGQWYRRRSVLTRRLLLLVTTVLLVGGSLWFIPAPYFVTAPGAAVDTSRLVTVQGGTVSPRRLYMLVITSRPANLFWYLYAQIDSRVVLESPQDFLGDLDDYAQYEEMSRQMMSDSQQTAIAVALHQLGYGQGVRSRGVDVMGLAPDSPAANLLYQGDRLVEAAGEKVQTVSDLTEILGRVSPGTPVMLRVWRNSQPVTVTVIPQERSDDTTARLGIYVQDSLVYDIPIPVDIATGHVTGPSAGLMFTLQIIDQLTPGGIAGSGTIAGTGTIGPHGEVGIIGGVQQKVHTAKAAGAQAMFVPRGNYEEARSAAVGIQIVPVDHVRDALEWLETRQNESEVEVSIMHPNVDKATTASL